MTIARVRYLTDNDNGHLVYYVRTGKDVLRDVGRRHLGVIFARPWPKCNGETHIGWSGLKPTLQSKRTKEKKTRTIANND